MSYILDALKKNQAEQTGDGVTLRVQPDRASWASRNALIYVLVAVVLVNLGLLGWIFQDELRQVTSGQPADSPSTTSATPANQAPPSNNEVTDRPAPSQTSIPSTTAKADVVAKTIKPTATTPPVAAPQTAQPSSLEPAKTSTSTSSSPEPRPRETGKTRTPIPLAELPPAEQIIYREFNYSSHIYTDDPTLCAIVIDGQRLKAGDAFKGLKVHAVTEAGVIFDETRRGVSRLIEVSIFELWDT